MPHISVVDGALYQWDIGRKIRIVPKQGETITNVHYNNGNVVELSQDGDALLAQIPNILLQSPNKITVFVVFDSADCTRTVCDRTFSVIEKPKPDDYVYEETEVLTITSVVNKALEEAKNSGAFDGADGVDGKDGYTPQKSVDYWTSEDKAEIETYIDEQTEIIKTDVEGLQQQINEEAHFRGYLSTNAKIQALVATPNDFAYSAESGTKWIYDAEDGWKDSGTPVPDQLTPASDTTPLINGVASVGTEEAYARGDHRHPTDTTRLSVADFNAFKADLETSLDNVIAKYGLGGDVV
jgi:hypothetical protein